MSRLSRLFVASIRHTRATLAPRLLAALAVAAIVLGVQLHASGTAFADGRCAPYQNGLTTYQNQGCVYNFGNTPPYSKNSGDFLYVNYLIDGGFPTNIYNDIQAAVNNWSNSGANIRFSQANYYNGQSNFLTISPSTTGANFGPYNGTNYTSQDCQNDAWGQSWYLNSNGTDNGLKYTVHLNSNLFSLCPWDTSWIGVAVHETGHTLGLAHNDYCFYCSSNGPNFGANGVNVRMNTNGVSLAQPPCPGCGSGTTILSGSNINVNNGANWTCSPGNCGRDAMVNPQVTDYWIFDQIYPSPPLSCRSYPSNFWCNGMDPSSNQQNCVASGADNQHVGTPYGWVEIWYSSGCQSNWTKGGANSGWNIYRILIQRDSGTDGGFTTIEDTALSSTWYTNVIYSPNNHDRSCISFINTSNGTITQWYCTAWH